MDHALRRRAARVICFDRRRRVLLLHWRDPGSGQLLWEPPGGGVEAGESDHEAARRELHEETGFEGALDDTWAVEVERDFFWDKQRFVGPERFYGLQMDDAGAAEPAALTGTEATALVGYGWFAVEDLGHLADRLEPPELPAVIESLVEMRKDAGAPPPAP